MRRVTRQGLAFAEAIETCGGQDVVWEALIESGGRVATTASRLGVSRNVLAWWLTSTPERREMYVELRALIAMLAVDEVQELLRAEPERHPIHGSVDTGWVAHQRLLADGLRWLAERMDPSLRQSGGLPNSIDINVMVHELITAIRSPKLATLATGAATVASDAEVAEPRSLPAPEQPVRKLLR